MDSTRWQKVQSLFHQVAELPGAEQRSFLEKECGDDVALASEVLTLLQKDACGVSLLDRDVVQVVQQVFHDPSSASPPFKQFGPYRIISVLGEGGWRWFTLPSVRIWAVRLPLKSCATIKLS